MVDNYYKWIDNDRWRYKAVSVTAYNPVYDDIRKRPIISFGDVDKTMTLDEYLKIENAYIDAVKIIMKLSKCEWLKIRYLERHYDLEDKEVNDVSKELYNQLISIENDQVVTLDNLEFIMRFILRNFIWCNLVNLSKRLYIRFGFDYYMYFNTKLKQEIYKESIEKLGLFVD